MGLDVQQIGSIDELTALVPEWSDLTGRSPFTTIFQTPEWLLPWWRHSGSGEMWTLAFRKGGALVGLLPQFLHEWCGQRQFTLMGNGLSDHLDLIADPEYATACAAAAFDALQQNRKEWELCDWQDLPAYSPLLTPPHTETMFEVSDYLPCTELELPSSEQEYCEALSHGLRRNLRRYRDKLEREFEVQFDTTSVDVSGELVETLFALHGKRWRTRGEDGMLAGHEPFFRDVTAALSSAGRLRIHMLKAGTRIIGLIYQPRYRDRAYGYITGFDPEFERFSPGALLLDHALRDAIVNGACRWDFLRGQERYKFQWGAREIRKRRLRLWRGPDHPALTRVCNEVTSIPIT